MVADGPNFGSGFLMKGRLLVDLAGLRAVGRFLVRECQVYRRLINWIRFHYIM